MLLLLLLQARFLPASKVRHTALTLSKSAPASSAMNPSMAKTTIPQRMEVAQLARATATASRWQFRRKRL